MRKLRMITISLLFAGMTAHAQDQCARYNLVIARHLSSFLKTPVENKAAKCQALIGFVSILNSDLICKASISGTNLRLQAENAELALKSTFICN